MEVSNNMLAALVIVAMAVSLAGTMSMLSIIPGKSNQLITGMQTLQQTGLANATLASAVHIQLRVPTVAFGTIAKGSVNDTVDFSPHPFVLRNNGTEIANVSIGESTGTGSGPLWAQDDSCENCFMYNSTPNSTSGAVAYTAWRNFDGNAEAANAGALSTNPANLVYNLSNSCTGETPSPCDVDIHLNITPPTSELGGYKEGTIYFLAAQG
jgi:hypothetical protein